MTEPDAGDVYLLVRYGGEELDDFKQLVKKVEDFYKGKDKLKGVFSETTSTKPVDAANKIKEITAGCSVVFMAHSVEWWMIGSVTKALKSLKDKMPVLFAAYQLDKELDELKDEFEDESLNICKIQSSDDYEDLVRHVQQLYDNNKKASLDSCDGRGDVIDREEVQHVNEVPLMSPLVEGKDEETQTPPVESEAVLDVDSSRYAIDYTKNKHVGLCLILNMTQFDTPDLEDRIQAFKDTTNMTNSFSSLGFNVMKKINCTAEEAMEFFRQGQQECERMKPDVFTCIISTHGEEVIEAVKCKEERSQTDAEQDGQERTASSKKPVYNTIKHRLIFKKGTTLETVDIVALFNDDNCDALKNKPRSFFIQACSSRARPPEENLDLGVTMYVRETEQRRETDNTARQGKFVSSFSDSMDAKGKRVFPMEPKKVEPTSGAPSIPPPGGSINTVANSDMPCRAEPVKKPDTEAGAEPVKMPDTEAGAELVKMPDTEAGAEPVKKPDTEAGAEPVKKPETEDLKAGTEPTKNPETEDLKAQGEVTMATQAPTSEEEDYIVNIPVIPCFTDALIVFASPPGQVAFSRMNEGGWLIKCLHDQINDFIKRHNDKSVTEFDLLHELTGVSYRMALNMEERDCGYKSVPCIRHMLTKDVMLKLASQTTDRQGH